MSVGINNDKTLKAINISDNSKSYPNSNLSYFATENNNINILSVPKIAPINTDKLEICGFENGILKPVINITNKTDNTDIECNIQSNLKAIGLDVTGNINFTGNITKDGDPLISSLWTEEDNSNNIYYNNGNVGIGTNNPNYDLDVTGNINFSGNITNNGSALVSSVWTEGNNNNHIYYDNGDGRVGIGNSAPSYTLDVSGGIYGQNLYTMYNIYSTNGALALRSASGSGMNFYTNNLGTARMSIDTNGYVGINTPPSSSYQLDVNGGIRGSSVRTYHYYYSDSHMYFKPNSGYNMYFETNNSTRMTIDTSGYVGIGTPPSYRLHVNGDSYLSGTTYLYGTVYRSGGWETAMWKKSSSNAYWDEGNVGIGTTPSYRFHVSGNSYLSGTTYLYGTVYRSGGWETAMWEKILLQCILGRRKVGIGTSSPSYPLHIATTTLGESFSAARFAYNGVGYGAISTHSDAISLKCSGQIWCLSYVWVSSDNRIKTNIVDVPDNLALEELRNIPCKYYEYIDKLDRGSDKTIGFIAQEVKSVFPMAVTQKKEIIPNIYKTINSTWTTDDDKFIMSSTDLTNVNGVKYKFYVCNETDASDENVEVTGNSDNTFTFDSQYTNVFCYGSEVDDFHILDKNKLFTLNFSATQEIDRIQQTHITKIETLETENTELKEEVSTLKDELATLKDELAQIKIYFYQII